MDALKEAGVQYLGAGINKEEACAPLFINLDNIKIACLARTCVLVSSPSYAGEDQPGVAFLNVEETKESINSCKQQADTVILLIHWGIEEYHYPSPYQRLLSRDFIKSGADLIFGHHPHVLQGVEAINKKLIFYSLGNFLFDDFIWSYVDQDGHPHNSIEKLSSDNRKGGILGVTLSGDEFYSYEFLPTLIQSDGIVKEDYKGERLKDFGLLSSRLQWPGYNLFWRAYSMRQEWTLRLKPQLIGKLTWSNLKKLRFGHFKLLLDRLWRSASIIREKSTNPYE
jgi:hypothetical protein